MMMKGWNTLGSMAEQAPLVGGGQDYRAMQNARPPAPPSINVLGEVKGLEEDVFELELAVTRVESLLRGADTPQPATACPTPCAVGERLSAARSRVHMVKMALDRVCVELAGD